MAKDLTEGRIFNKDDLTWLESILEKEIDEIGKELSKRKTTLAKLQQLRFISGNHGGESSVETFTVIANILGQAGEPLAKREIRARYEKIKGGEIPISVIEDCLYEHRDKYFQVVGERAAAKWRLIEKGI